MAGVEVQYSDEICELEHAGDVPASVLASLPKNQGHPVRHRCAACAYLAGVRDAGGSPSLSTRQQLWAGRLLMLMVAELHRRGAEGLRIVPYMAPSGFHWRCEIVPITNISREHGARPVPSVVEPARYSASQGFEFFGWGDCQRACPSDLADLFERAFPDITSRCRVGDPSYREWFRLMLRDTEPLGLPIAFADYETSQDALDVIGECAVRVVRLPPPRSD